MKRFFLITLVVMCFSVVLFAEAAQTHEVTVSDLSSWEGVNMSVTSILSGVRKNAYCKEIAQYKDGYDAQLVSIFIDKMYYTTFKQFEVLEDGRTVIFDNMITAEYDYAGTLSTKWGEYDVSWYIFKTSSQEAIAGGYKYLLLFPYHGHGDGTPHMHMRYGNANFDYLTTDPGLESWWPTCYRSTEMDSEALFSELMSGAKMMTTMLPDIQ